MNCLVEGNNGQSGGQFTAVMARNRYLRATRIKCLQQIFRRGRPPEPGFSRMKNLARIYSDVSVERLELRAKFTPGLTPWALFFSPLRGSIWAMC
jgi:hypothetical protein